MRKPSLAIIFLTVFIDLIGFGIVLPLLPIYGQNFGASGFMIGVIMSSFSLMQFIFSPWWGRLSDRIGRRPVLLISTAAASVSYGCFAVGSGLSGTTGLLVLLASRVMAGFCGANLSVAQAYIADVTPPEDRSKRMGLIGMAFGLGFICGPPLGGLSLKYFGMQGPGWVAAGICAANFLFALARLPESRKPTSEQAPHRPGLAQWRHTLGRPKIGLLIGLFFLATFCFTCFETTLGLLVSKLFHLDLKKPDDADKVAYLFAYAGFVGALVQGGAIGRAVKKLGEPRLISLSLVLVGISLAPMPFAHTWPMLLLFLGLLSIGSSLTRPPVFGMISMLTSADEQGATLGVAQGVGSVARILGPIFAATLFVIQPSLPYVICGGLSLLTALLAYQFLHKAEPVVQGSVQGAN